MSEDPIVAAVAATLRKMAEWGYVDSDGRPVRDELRDIATQVDMLDATDACCPVCEEVECDSDCPLASVRARLANPSAYPDTPGRNV